MSTFIIQLKRKGSTLECQVEADDRLEARTLALRKLFGPGAYWHTEFDPKQGCAIVPRERKRGKRVVFEEKKRSPIYRIHVERLE
ncbi:MAG TPA: hypothetical protein VE967_19410 [Gemmatimonadaceae bacterium]|nr:hypothetical protein [Gemmatimonadaceae bacterium]